MNIRISGVLNLFAVALLCGFALATGAAVMSLMELRVGGPVSQRQMRAQELTADILPPPMYVVEAFLDAQVGEDHPEAVADTLQRLDKLHKDYDLRYAHWRDAQLSSELRGLLIDQSNAEVQRFWTLMDSQYVPALKRGDLAAIRAALLAIETPYAAHRALIAKAAVVAAAEADAQVIDAGKGSRLVFGLLGAASLVMLTIVVTGSLVLRGKVILPLTRMTNYMTRLADGDYEQEAPHQGRADEIGEMARSVGVFRAAVLERRAAREEQDKTAARARADRQSQAEAVEVEARQRQAVVDALDEGLKRLVAGDLSQRLEDAFPIDYEQLRVNFNASIAALGQTIGQVMDSANAVGGGAREISVAADDLSRRTEHQAASLEETAAALDQVTGTIRQTAASADEASKAVSESRLAVEGSHAVAGQAMTAMERIESASSRITQIIGVIDEIAFQTNLLALNAGVEAARAGDAGRGFAVVAQEVRALAQRSADAAKEIKGLIHESSGAVQSGVGLVARVGAALTAVVDQFGHIEGLVRSIAGAAREQATGLSEVNTAVNQMDQVTQQNAAMVEQTTAASHSLSQEAVQLGELMDRFQVAPTSAGRRVA